MVPRIPWDSCKLATTLVLVHAAPRDSGATLEALKVMSGGLQGLPSMVTVNANTSADLAASRNKQLSIERCPRWPYWEGISLMLRCCNGKRTCHRICDPPRLHPHSCSVLTDKVSASSSPGESMSTHLVITLIVMEQGSETRGRVKTFHCRANRSLKVACPGLSSMHLR
jgi:hypothetical protein